MNEIIATIIAGLPSTVFVVVFIGGAILYGYLLVRPLESKLGILTGFWIAFGVFLCCIGLSYFFGCSI